MNKRARETAVPISGLTCVFESYWIHRRAGANLNLLRSSAVAMSEKLSLAAPVKSEPIPPLTGLRFVAALCVVIGHIGDSITFVQPDPMWHRLISSLSGIGMPLFFVLSGFVIHYNYSASIAQAPYRGSFNFFIARFARLYPMYFFIVVLDLYNYGYFESAGRAHILLAAAPSYLLLVQSWHYQVIGEHTLIFSMPAMTSVTWSVSTEFFFYFTYPLACLFLKRLRNTSAVWCAIFITIVAGYSSVYIVYFNLDAINSFAHEHFGQIGITHPDDFLFWMFYLSPYPRLFEFALGCLTAAMFITVQTIPVSKRESFFGRIGFGIAICGIACTYVLLFYSNIIGLPGVPVLQMYFGFAPFVAALLFCCARYRTWISAALSRPWVLACGEASYSIYLVHIGIVQYVQIRDQLANVSPASHSASGTLHLLTMRAIMVLLIIALSLTTYRLIEVPARQVLRRLRLPPVPPSLGRAAEK